LALMGQVIGAADAVYAKLASDYLEPESLESFISALEKHSFTGDVFAAITQIVKPFASVAPASTIDPKDSPIKGLHDYEVAINRHFSFDKSLAETIDSLERESDVQFKDWAQRQLAILAKRSPTSLRITHEGLLRGRKLSLAESFRMELAIVTQCFAKGDVLEGIRALVVDKDHSPKWNPAHLDAVDDADIAAYFVDTYPEGQHPLADLETFFGH
jgi:enoyl-CoA hydratase/carnithine racemase